MKTEKLIILCDVDGVISNFVKRALPIIKEIKNISLDPNTVTGFHLNIVYSLNDEQTEQYFRACESQGFVLGMELIPGVIEAIAELEKLSEIVYVTAPWPSSPYWMYERDKWIRDRFGPQSKIIHTNQKQYVQGDIFIDDRPLNVIEWASRNPNKLAILWDQPWNKDIILESGTGYRLNDWSQIINIVKSWTLLKTSSVIGKT